MNRIAYDAPVSRPPLSIAGGKADGAQIFAAAIDAQQHVDNTNAAMTALSDAYDARSRAIKAATGVDLGNPVGPFSAMIGEGEDKVAQYLRDRQADYQTRLDQLAGQYPQFSDIIKSTTPMARDAEALARASDEKLATMMASNPDWTTGVIGFGGAALGALRDPVTVGSLFLGGGTGGARTVAGRLLMTAASEAAVNAGVTAAMQPAVQDWRRRAGLPNGFDEAAKNVLLAAALGGTLGAAGRGIAEVAPKLLGRTAETLKQVRDVLPAEQRGAIDAADHIAATDAQRPDATPPDRFDRSVAAADAAAHRIEPAPIVPDEVSVNRIVNALAPAPESLSGGPPAAPEASRLLARVGELIDPPKAALRADTPLLSFLRRMGGVDPASPVAAELKAAGVEARSVYRKGGLKGLDNLPHDELPDALRAQIRDDGNGYADQQALIDMAGREAQGNPGGRTVDDVSAERHWYETQGVDFTAPREEIAARIAEVDAVEARYAGQSDEAVAVPDGLTRRQHTAELVRAVLRAQPGLPDPLVHEAVNLSLFERQPIDEALDDVLAAHGHAPAIPATPASPLAQQLEALPDTPPGLPEIRSAEADGEIAPDFAAERAALEELGFTGDVPIGDALMSLEEIDKQLKESAWLERVVEACKI